MNELRLGLTTRVIEEASYSELRDALAQDWCRFLKDVIPEAKWLMIPNLGKSIPDYIDDWGLNCFLLTGGNDLLEYPKRDETELKLIHEAQKRKLPILGVCRGFQMMAHYWNIDILPCTKTKHSGTRHKVKLIHSQIRNECDYIDVNSYHNNCVSKVSQFQNTPLIPFAVDSEGNIEGFFSRDHAMLGVMWHPEREYPATDFDKDLIRTFFLNEERWQRTL